MPDSSRKFNLESDRVIKVENWFNFDHFREEIRGIKSKIKSDVFSQI
jgi:hypothetical protein